VPTDRRDPQGQMHALTDAAAALARGADLDATIDLVLSNLAAALGAPMAAVLLRDPDRPELHLASVIGMSADSLGSFEAEVQAPGHPIAAAARDVVAAFGREGVGPDGAGLVGADIPLVVARDGLDLPLGVVSFAWPAPHPIDAADERLLRAAADLLATAVDRAHLASLVAERWEWFERMAHTDALTGLANRRTFDRVLELELARAGRQGGEVSVAIFDVDGLGSVNAGAGHETGDDILRTVAAVLAESVRLVDTVARYGGDEFVLVAPGSAGATVARRVLDGIAALDPVDGHVVSVSAGVARFPVDGANGEDLLAAADAALRAARDAGSGSLAEAGVGAS
jgi:diguanylate cyclase (GGDEF)-like protein